ENVVAKEEAHAAQLKEMVAKEGKQGGKFNAQAKGKGPTKTVKKATVPHQGMVESNCESEEEAIFDPELNAIRRSGKADKTGKGSHSVFEVIIKSPAKANSRTEELPKKTKRTEAMDTPAMTSLAKTSSKHKKGAEDEEAKDEELVQKRTTGHSCLCSPPSLDTYPIQISPYSIAMACLGPTSACDITESGQSILQQESSLLRVPDNFLLLLPSFNIPVPDLLQFTFPPLDTGSSHELVPTSELLMCVGFANTPSADAQEVELKDRTVIGERDELLRLLPELEKAGIPRVGTKTVTEP
ncbi:hypothetical protein FRC11_004890, partial [Ceratobasidium sp. 423]